MFVVFVTRQCRGAGWERDLEGFTEFFENPLFRPDGLKLCVLLCGLSRSLVESYTVAGQLSNTRNPWYWSV